MASDSLLFHVDAVVADGKPVAFEDGSATLSGAHRFENEVVTSAQGQDYARRRRVPTSIRLRMQFNNTVDPDALSKVKDIQITLRDTQSGRRALAQKCVFGSLGEIGGGAVDITYLVLTPIQWL